MRSARGLAALGEDSDAASDLVALAGVARPDGDGVD